MEVIRIFFRSKTCKSIFGGLSARKQKEWIYEFVNEIESSFIRKDIRETAIKSITLQELTNQPYCGPFLMYQLFEESSTANELLIKKSLKNCTDFDFIQYMNLEEIYDAVEYFDLNKLNELREMTIKLMFPNFRITCCF